MTYLVTGATGNLGRHVVESLLRKGHRVRALTRDPGRSRLPSEVELVRGDLSAPETVRAALDGVDGVHLLTIGGDDYATLTTGPQLVAAMEEAGVRKVVVLWNGSEGPVEEAVAASNLEWAQVRPNDFMSNALHWAADIRTRGEVREPFAASRNAAIHEADVGEVVATVLTGPGHAAQTYALSGPEALTAPEQVAAIGRALGRRLSFVELGEDEARDRWRSQGIDDAMVDVLVAWRSDPPPQAYTVEPTVEKLLGRAPRTFDQWAIEHADAFA